MNKNKLEIWVNRIVNRVLDGGTREDDLVEIKGDWPGPEQAGQLAGMANAAGGHPILWIIGVSEKRHQFVDFEKDRDLNVWWPPIEKQFAHGVAPHIQTQYFDIERNDGTVGTVCAAMFETDRAPYMVYLKEDDKDRGTRWARAAIPWRTATGLDTATRAQLLSLLDDAVKVPELEVIGASARLDLRTAKIPPEPMRLRIGGKLFIDSKPGQHVLFPTHRHQLVVTSEAGDMPEADRVHITTATPAKPVGDVTSGFGHWQVKEINPYGATDRPDGLVVRAPDFITFSATIVIVGDENSPITQAPWIDLSLTLPISSSDHAPTTRVRLHRFQRELPPTAQKPLARWITDDAPDAPYLP